MCNLGVFLGIILQIVFVFIQQLMQEAFHVLFKNEEWKMRSEKWGMKNEECLSASADLSPVGRWLC